MKSRILRVLLPAVFAVGLISAATPSAASTLYIGTDTEEFNGLPGSFLMTATVNGPNFVSETLLPLSFALNGIGDGPGFLYAGAPESNTLRYVDPTTGTEVAPAVAAGFSATCCNEELQIFNGTLYHAHWNDNIQAINP